MHRALLLAILLVVPALAGCASTTDVARSKVGLERGEIPAKSAVALARDTAEAWAADAALTGALTFEAPDDRYAGGNDSVPPDPEVGNGRAPAWLLTYHSTTRNESLSLAVYPNGTAEREEPEEEPGDEVHPIDEDAWAVDAPEALDALRENATWQSAEADGAESYLHALGADEEGIHWFILMFRENATPVFGAVNAVNGTVENVGDFGFDWDWDWDWDWEWGGGDWDWDWPKGWPFSDCDGKETEREYEGRLTTASATAEHTFNAPDAGMLTIDLQVSAMVPEGRVTFEVRDPDGDVVQEGHVEGGSGSSTTTDPVSRAGPYTIALTLEGPSPVANYEITATHCA